MRAIVLIPLILLGWSLQAVGQTSPTPSEQSVSGGIQTPVANTPATSGSPVATAPELQLVVALFRHGVRAPLKDIDDPAKPHAGNTWPSKNQWGVDVWGDLTPHGIALARALGRDYARELQEDLASRLQEFPVGGSGAANLCNRRRLEGRLPGWRYFGDRRLSVSGTRPPFPLIRRASRDA